MTVEQIVSLIVESIPSIIAVVTTVCLVMKTLGEFKHVKDQVNDMKCIEELKSELKRLLQDNYDLKAQIKKTMTIIDHIDRSKE